MFPRAMVCLRNISVDTLHKGDTDDNNNSLLLLLLLLKQTLISLYTHVPHPSQSQSTFYNHQSTHLLPLLLLPLSSQLMAFLLLYFLSRWESQNFRTHFQTCTLRLGITGIFGIPNQILRDTETEFLKTLNSGTVPGRPWLLESSSFLLSMVVL